MSDPKPTETVVIRQDGIVAAGREVATGIVGSLSSTPSLLAIILLNVTMVVMAGFYLLKQEELRTGVVQQLMEFTAAGNKETTELIRACIMKPANEAGKAPP